MKKNVRWRTHYNLIAVLCVFAPYVITMNRKYKCRCDSQGELLNLKTNALHLIPKKFLWRRESPLWEQRVLDEKKVKEKMNTLYLRRNLILKDSPLHLTSKKFLWRRESSLGEQRVLDEKKVKEKMNTLHLRRNLGDNKWNLELHNEKKMSVRKKMYEY